MIADKLSSFLQHLENGVGEKTHRVPHHLWYDELLELAGIGLWFVSPQGETTYVNKAMAARLGYSREEVMALMGGSSSGRIQR